MKSNLSFLLALLLLVLSIPVISQEDNNKEETFLGIGSGSRKISKFQKSPINPFHVDSTMQMEEIKYYLEPKQQQVSYDIENIKPARLKIVEPLKKLYSGYVKAGAGSYLTPLLQLNYSSLRSKYDSWGVRGNIQSSFGNIKDMGNTRYTDASLGGYFQKFFNDHDLWAEMDYKKNIYHFYGLNYGVQDPDPFSSFQDKDSVNFDSFGQDYDLFDINVKFNSKNNGRDTSKLRYKTWMDFHHLNSQYELKENHFLLGAHSGWVIMDEEFLGTLELDVNNLGNPSLFIDTSENNNINIKSRDISLRTSTIVRFNPHIYTRKKNLVAKVGISLQANLNDDPEGSNFKFFPDIDVSYSLFNNVFIPYGGLKGNVQRNTFNSIRLHSPFVSEDSDVFNTIQEFNLYFGIRGSMSSKFTFNLSYSIERFDNFYFFTPTSFYENKFQLTYDNVDRTSIIGELTYQESEKLKISAKSEFFNYNPGSEMHAWQRPNFRFTLGSVLDLSDKIIVKGDVFFIGSRNVYSHFPIEGVETQKINDKNDSPEAYVFKLKPFIDMNLSAEYRYNKKVSAFIQFNNFIAKKYQYWTNFPVQSINIMGGVTLSF